MLSLAVGVVVGYIIAFLNLPVPAPINFGAILGILGLYIGYSIHGVLK